jgi:hypothetical protein
VNLQAQIDALERLAALDAQLKDLEDQLSRERESLSGKQSHLAELDAKLTASQKSVAEMERMRNDLMQELRQMSLQIDRSREKLSRCRTEREANAVQRELEELRKLYRDRELEIEKLTGLVDQARAEIESTEKEQGELSAELGKTSGEVESRLGGVEKDAQTKYDTRKQIVGEIQPALYRRYELVRKRKGTAIAFTEEGTCSECHMLLPPMMFQKLMRSEEFGQCPSCHRILYFRPAGPGEEGAEAQDTQSSGA